MQNEIRRAIGFTIVPLLLIISYAFPYAQDVNAQTRIAAQLPATSHSSCLMLTVDLSFGSTNLKTQGQVSTLQKFLDVIPTTGYFGILTQTALQKWQATHNIVSSGSPATTGYGRVGPKTRAALANCVAIGSLGTSTPSQATSTLTPVSPRTTTAGSSVPSSGGSGSSAPVAPSASPSPSQATNIPTPTSPRTTTAGSSVPSSGGSGSSAPVSSPTPPTILTSPTPQPSSLTINDFWNGTANFEFVRRQQNPSADTAGNISQGNTVNAQSYITVVGNTWYRFSREQVTNKLAPSGCPYGLLVRIVLYESNDQGATWNNRTVVVEPTINTPWACEALDGTPFFDQDTTTWDYVFQCLTTDGVWNICKASRASADPIGPWTVYPSAVIRSGEIFSEMGLPSYYDEGTPQIIQKVGPHFYMTFHGFNGQNGVRAVAWSDDLIHWLPTISSPTFTSADCADWNVPWTGGCIGGGWADTHIIGNYYYVLIEAADKNLLCGVQNQQWVFGLLRTTNITTPAWQELPHGPGIIYNSAQQPDLFVCGDSYAQLFVSGNDTYLTYMREDNAAGNQDTDPNTARYYYKLVAGGPIASYTFPLGIPQDTYAASDAISRGDLEARVANVAWLNPGLGMNGINSVVTLPSNPILHRTAPWSLDLSFTLSATPGSKSAFLAGDHGAGWLEADPYNGQLSLCAWVQSAQGPQNICTTQSLNTPTDAALIVTPTSFSLSVNGSIVGSKQATGVPVISTITAGSAGAQNGYYGSWQGTLSKLSLYDYAITQ